MTTWTSISNAAVAVGSIPSSTTVTALRDNPSALAESASGAPVMVSGWHPHDKVSIGDGKTGLIYDFAVNGVQANITSPNFTDGYEYRIFGVEISHNNASSTTLIVELYKETSATWVSIGSFPSSSASSEVYFNVDIIFPRISGSIHFAPASWGSALSVSAIAGAAALSTIQKVLNVRVRFAAGSIDSGKIWMFRRREYASSP